MARLVILFVLIAVVTAAILPRNQGKAVAPFCNATACLPPDCRCCSTNIPGGLAPVNTPQTVLITFDNEVTNLNYEYYNNLIFSRLNPNGCPIKATYFVSHEYNNYTLVNDLYNRGHEIASHSVTHRSNSAFWLNANVKMCEMEMADMKTMISYYASIPLNAIKGARTPGLLENGDEMWTALTNNDFEWDSSWPTRSYVNPGLWPYTLDYRSTQDCPIGRCPVSSFPGKWVVPMIDLSDEAGNPCAMLETCTFGPTATDVFNLLKTNFEIHYNGNRSPFDLFLHADWLFDAVHLEGYKMFLDELALLKDVYLISMSQLVDWVKNPTPVADINNFAPWKCPSVQPIPCTERTCHYTSDQTPFESERDMSICTRECPPFYPWYGNIYGTNPPTPWVP